jgi:hypothetical protein
MSTATMVERKDELSGKKRQQKNWEAKCWTTTSRRERNCHKGCQEGMCIWPEVNGQAGNCEKRDSEL